MVTYADSSFLVSLYIQDSHTVEARKFLVSHSFSVLLTNFSKSETQHAIRTLAFRKMITIGEMTQGLIHFERAQEEGVYELRLSTPDELFENAAHLSNRHALEFGVRYLDMLHIASALLLNAKRFLTFDARQAKLAKTVGLHIKP
jgi:predicted nucleic acid-binding protein